jgi:hypothetical protein
MDDSHIVIPHRANTRPPTDGPGPEQVADEHRQAQARDRHAIDEEVGEDDFGPGDGLGEEQLHGAAVDLAGDGPGGPADGPDAEDELHHRVDVADGQHVHGLVQHDSLAADDRPQHAAETLGEDELLHVLAGDLRQAGQADEERGDAAEDAFGDPRPQVLEQAQKGHRAQEVPAQVAEQLEEEDAGHCPSGLPWCR